AIGAIPIQPGACSADSEKSRRPRNHLMLGPTSGVISGAAISRPTPQAVLLGVFRVLAVCLVILAPASEAIAQVPIEQLIPMPASESGPDTVWVGHSLATSDPTHVGVNGRWDFDTGITDADSLGALAVMIIAGIVVATFTY